jgi:hypothetical protein
LPRALSLACHVPAAARCAGPVPSSLRVRQTPPACRPFRPSNHPRDQSGDLHRGVGPGRPWHPQMRANQVVQPGALGQHHDRNQTRVRHEVRIIETYGNVVANSHLPDAPLSGSLRPSRSHIVPGQKGIRVSRRAQDTSFTGGSRLSCAPQPRICGACSRNVARWWSGRQGRAAAPPRTRSYCLSRVQPRGRPAHQSARRHSCDGSLPMDGLARIPAVPGRRRVGRSPCRRRDATDLCGRPRRAVLRRHDRTSSRRRQPNHRRRAHPR